ncbi:dihydrofolate reductase family protein [Paractinoplanes ferrugineus]|uniref:Riboflavin biosynthesis protein RibD n=1 Tax=Paractinoplanes ferrugineus TaxID=113564 RepID=A0A919ME76_9ACTN|nr:dihydrofolate reductase family protein [Actinoplanes ferrugineus]GIE11359.1 riboflavin biosynthesis protein RibD [Actinoplanes ferrugineus]
MGDVIVIQFSTLDGVVSDPNSWAFGAGPVTEDKFRLGERMATGVQLYGRHTWEQFAKLWPGRDSDYARLMNTVPKRVATRTGVDTTAWANSAAVEGDLAGWVTAERERRDIVVIGSLSVVRALAAADLVDEYRVITFPAVVGAGDRLFAAGPPAEFRFTVAEPVGTTVLTMFRRSVDRTP